MPTMLVTSECDGDVGFEGPRGYRQEQLIDPQEHRAIALDPDVADAWSPK